MSWKSFALALLIALAGACGDSQASKESSASAWDLVPPERVAEECKLDPELLRVADESLDRPWAVVRYGKLCHEFYPSGTDAPTWLASASKTLGAVVTGVAAWQTRDLPRTGRKTGPLSDADRVDHWLDEFSFNPDAQIGHVLGMVAHNEDLRFGRREHVYDAAGKVQINRLSDVINTAIGQDPDRLGSDLEVFTQRFVFGPLGMRDSIWTGGAPDKNFATSWEATVRDMARLGLLILDGGVWNGERLLAKEWVDKITHPAFEDTNTSYGYLTWLASRSNFHFGGILGGAFFQGPLDRCAPSSIWSDYPHGISEAVDCGYDAPYDCEQEFDVGVWAAQGAGGQLIVGHPGLDMILIGKDLGDAAIHPIIWGPVRPAVVALDERFQGDVTGFCAAYGANRYAPDLRSRIGP